MPGPARERVVGLVCAFLRKERLGVTAAALVAELHEKYPGCVPDHVGGGELEEILARSGLLSTPADGSGDGDHRDGTRQAAAASAAAPAAADAAGPAQQGGESKAESEDESGDEGWRGALGLSGGEEDEEDEEDATREGEGAGGAEGGARAAEGTPAKERDRGQRERPPTADEKVGRRRSTADTQATHTSASRDGDAGAGERDVTRRETHRGDRKEEHPRARGDRGASDRPKEADEPRYAAPGGSSAQPRDARERDRDARERDRVRVKDDKGNPARSSAEPRQPGRGQDAINLAGERASGWRPAALPPPPAPAALPPPPVPPGRAAALPPPPAPAHPEKGEKEGRDAKRKRGESEHASGFSALPVDAASKGEIVRASYSGKGRAPEAARSPSPRRRVEDARDRYPSWQPEHHQHQRKRPEHHGHSYADLPSKHPRGGFGASSSSSGASDRGGLDAARGVDPGRRSRRS